MTTSTQPTAMAAAIKLPQTVSSAKGVFDDLDALKLSLEDVGLTGATEVLMRVPVRKPMKHVFASVPATRTASPRFCMRTRKRENITS